MSLEGKTALVTGASRGLGRAIARRLAQEGAAVGVNYSRSAREAEDLVEEIRKSGGRALPLCADVSVALQVSSTVETREGALGPVDVLSNNAGVMERADLGASTYTRM